MIYNPRTWLYIIIFIIILLFPVLCKETAYSYGESGAHSLDSGNITEYKGSDLVTSAVASATPDGRPIPGKARTVEEIKKEINLKLNVGNKAVRDEAQRLILEYPGDGTISQVCSIYDYMVGNWSYARDIHGIEVYQYSNESLDKGQGKFSGQGDCDDFAILLASLIESIGGTSRIMLAYGPMGGHAYTEVYLGKAEGVDSDVDRMIKWLRARYKVSDIKTHTDLDTGDVWLNLDWWRDPDTGAELAKHPGGPFFNATHQTPILIREDVPKDPLKPLNDPPIAQFSVSSASPNAKENVTFDASSSRDIGPEGGIERYLWTFGDGSKGEGKIVTHAYLQGDRYRVNLTVIDNDGAPNSSMQTVEVNANPSPVIDYQPKQLIIMDKDVQISFNASQSKDIDGEIKSYAWEFGDGDESRLPSPSHYYKEAGNYTINLTVKDDKGAKNTTYRKIRVSEIQIEITNINEYNEKFESVSKNKTVLGNYAPADYNDSILIFVESGDKERYYPQSTDNFLTDNVLMKNGKWEKRIKIGENKNSDKGAVFVILVAVAKNQTRKFIADLGNNLKEPGFSSLPSGVFVKKEIQVSLSSEKWDRAPSISNVNLTGIVQINEINNIENTIHAENDGDLVDDYMIVNGSCSTHVNKDRIWILQYASNGKWYPQSDNTNIQGHVKNCLNISPTEWSAGAWFGGKSGEPGDLVVVLASPIADKFFDEYQRNCSKTLNPNGEKGHYPGLLTIELPPGIDEKDRMRILKK